MSASSPTPLPSTTTTPPQQQQQQQQSPVPLSPPSKSPPPPVAATAAAATLQACVAAGDLQQVLESGVDLRHFCRQVALQLRAAETGSIGDYIGQSGAIVQLHRQLGSCDQLLAHMERQLGSFSGQLASISEEIVALQRQSVLMNQRLKNQQAVRCRLTQLVDELTLPEAMVRHICRTPVADSSFAEQLSALDAKLAAVRVYSGGGGRVVVAACADVQPLLQRLRVKAVARVRHYLLERVQQLRRPLANYQLPQNALLAQRHLVAFLQRHAPDTAAAQVRADYVDTMAKVYCSCLSAYWARLLPLLATGAAPTRHDLLAADDTGHAATRSIFSLGGGGGAGTPGGGAGGGGGVKLRGRTGTVFSLGDRAAVLEQLEESAIVPHAAAADSFTVEQLYRSGQYVLLDNACREYLFLAEFFGSGAGDNSGGGGGAGEGATQQLFGAVLGRSLQQAARHCHQLLAGCHDLLGVFLCIHLVQRLQLLCHKRAVPALDAHWERQLQLLWPLFERLLEANVASVRECEPQRLTALDTRPHVITRRYAELTLALLTVNEPFPAERVHRLLMHLRVQMEALLLRMAGEFANRCDQLVLLINNYDLILSVLQERPQLPGATSATSGATGGASGHSAGKEVESFGELLAQRSDEYVQLTLAPHFGGLMQFVRDAERLVDQGKLEALAEAAVLARAARLITSFNATWRQALQQLNSQLMQAFTNFRTGSQLLQEALKQLVIYCDRFQRVLALQPLRAVANRSDMINTLTIMVEVKKYKPNF